MATKTRPPTEWLATRGWQAFPFQREVWREMAKGRSGLLHATTGSGKTLAVWLGALQTLADTEAPLTVLWITPIARAQPRHAAGPARRGERPRPALDAGCAHRRHRQQRTRVAAAPLAHGAGDDAGVAEPAVVPRRRARRAPARAPGGRGRMARAAGQQARRAVAARARAAAPLEPGADDLGPVRHARQSGRGTRHAGAARRARAGQAGQADRHRHAAARPHRALRLGRPHGAVHVARGRRAHRRGGQQPRVHEHALAVANAGSRPCWTRGPTGPD